MFRVFVVVVFAVFFGAGCAFGAASPEQTTNGIGWGSDDEPTAWGFHYKTPAGFRAEERPAYTVLGREGGAGVVVLLRATLTNDADAGALLASFTAGLGYGAPRELEAPAWGTVANLRALRARYAVTGADGSDLRVRAVTLFTSFGTSLTVVAISDAHEADALGATADALASGVTARAPAVNHTALVALAGTWNRAGAAPSVRATAAERAANLAFVETTFSFAGGGALVAADAAPSALTVGDAASLASGKFTVIGSQIVLQGERGTLVVPFTLEGDVLVIGGHRYARQHG